MREVIAAFESSRFDGMGGDYHSVTQSGPVRYSCRGVSTNRENGPQGDGAMRACVDVELLRP